MIYYLAPKVIVVMSCFKVPLNYAVCVQFVLSSDKIYLRVCRGTYSECIHSVVVLIIDLSLAVPKVLWKICSWIKIWSSLSQRNRMRAWSQSKLDFSPSFSLKHKNTHLCTRESELSRCLKHTALWTGFHFTSKNVIINFKFMTI